jgi:hypothetical protein
MAQAVMPDEAPYPGDFCSLGSLARSPQAGLLSITLQE